MTQQLPPDDGYDDYGPGQGYGGYSSGYGLPPMPNLGKAELIDKIKPDVIVEAFRQRLLGKEFKDGQWIDVEALKDRKLSEIGAWDISNLMFGISTINITISKVDVYEIKQRLKNIVDEAISMMVTNWEEYKVHNTAQMGYVYQIIFTNTWAVLNQAKEGSIQELLSKTVFESRNVNTSPQRESFKQKASRILGLGGG